MLYRNSLSPVFGLRREIDKLFEDTFSPNAGTSAVTPAVDVRETPGELTFEGPATPPPQVLQHRAVLQTPDGRPFSLLVETYTDRVLTP